MRGSLVVLIVAIILTACGKREETLSSKDQATLAAAATDVIENDNRAVRRQADDLKLVRQRAEDQLRSCVSMFLQVENKLDVKAEALAAVVASHCANDHDLVTDLTAEDMEGNPKAKADYRTQQGTEAARLAAVMPGVQEYLAGKVKAPDTRMDVAPSVAPIQRAPSNRPAPSKELSV